MSGDAGGRRTLSPGTVPIPTAVVDDLLPTLKDTELRILLVVLRQTLGRGGHKAADWLSHTQLKARTGRAGEAVSAAVDVLVRHGLIIVRHETGSLLATAVERRRAGRRGTRLLFSVGHALREVDAAPIPSLSLAVALPAGKPKTTEYRKENICRLRFSEKPEDIENSEDGHQGERIEAAKRLIRQRLAGLAAPPPPEPTEALSPLTDYPS